MAENSSKQPQWLVLLPAPLQKITLPALRAAYGPCLTQILRKAAEISSSSSSVTIVDVGLTVSRTQSSNDFERFFYHSTQNLIAHFYRLICLTCTEQNIDVQYGNDVDARVFLFQHEIDGSSKGTDDLTVAKPATGPILTLQALASSKRSWQHLCSVNNQVGETLIQGFLRFRHSASGAARQDLAVEKYGGDGFPELSDNISNEHDKFNEIPSSYYDSVAVGGTFDHLHAGHKLLLTMTALVLKHTDSPTASRTLTVGITGDELLKKKKFQDYLQSWNQRQDAVHSFLLSLLELDTPSEVETTVRHNSGSATQGQAVLSRLTSGIVVRYIEIFDAFGPTITEESISALVVSGETRDGGKAVNDKRTEKGWSPLQIFEVDVLDSREDGEETSARDDQNFQEKISSTAIRQRLHQQRSKAAG